MKKIQLYECEICKTNYAEEQKAIACEKHHRKNPIVIDCKYNSMDRGSFDGCPIKITVRFADGKEATYRR